MATGRTKASGAARVVRPVVVATSRSDARPRAKEVGGPLVGATRPEPARPAAPERTRAGRPAAKPGTPEVATTRGEVWRGAPAKADKPDVAEARRREAPPPVEHARPAAPTVAKMPAGPMATPVGPMATPVGPMATPVGPMAQWSARDVLAGLRERMNAVAGATYGMGVALQELAKPERYRDELGFRSLEELLTAHGLPSRVTAYKLITVVTTFSLREVNDLGGMEKSFLLVRGVRREDPRGDVRKVLAPGARIAGVDVRAASVRTLRAALRALGRTPLAVGRGPVQAGDDDAGAMPLADPGAAGRAGERLRSACRRATLPARIRVHHEDGVACVSAHFVVASAVRLAQIIRVGYPHAPPPS